MSTINITDARRVAAALRVTENRVLKVANDLGCTMHTINGRAFIDVNDEDRIKQHIDAKGLTNGHRGGG
jgi:hypothetical protein